MIFTKWIWFANSFKCFSDRNDNVNVWFLGQEAKICEKIFSELLQKIHTKFYEIALAEHVGGVKTVVTNHLLRKKLYSLHKAAERNILQPG